MDTADKLTKTLKDNMNTFIYEACQIEEILQNLTEWFVSIKDSEEPKCVARELYDKLLEEAYEVVRDDLKADAIKRMTFDPACFAQLFILGRLMNFVKMKLWEEIDNKDYQLNFNEFLTSPEWLEYDKDSIEYLKDCTMLEYQFVLFIHKFILENDF